MRTIALLSLLFLLQDEKPKTYWLGWYHPLGEPGELEGLAKQGCNLMRGGFDHKAKKLESNKPEVVKAYLDAAAAKGVKVLLQPPATWVSKQNWEALKKWIEQWKDHEGLMGWYLFDEPEIHKVTVEQLQEGYTLVKELDPKHPVAVCFAPINDMKSIDEFAACYDILMFDYYPCRGKGEFPPAVKGWAGVLDRIVKKSKKHKKEGFIMVLQGFQDAGTRVPTPAEARYLLYTTAVRDTMGALFFCDGWCPEETQRQINEQIKELSGIPVREGAFMDPAVGCDQPAIKYRLMKNHLIAINESDAEVEATLKLPTRAKEVEVVGESRKLSGAEKFSKYQVRVYRWN